MFHTPQLPKSEEIKAYLISRYSCRAEMKRHAQQLRRIGIRVVSHWHDRDPDPPKGYGESRWEHWAEVHEENLNALALANVVMVFGDTPGGRYAGGDRHDELATAREHGKTLILIGDPSTCAQCAIARPRHQQGPYCARFATWHECLGHLLMLANPKRESTEEAA